MRRSACSVPSSPPPPTAHRRTALPSPAVLVLLWRPSNCYFLSSPRIGRVKSSGCQAGKHRHKNMPTRILMRRRPRRGNENPKGAATTGPPDSARTRLQTLHPRRLRAAPRRRRDIAAPAACLICSSRDGRHGVHRGAQRRAHPTPRAQDFGSNPSMRLCLLEFVSWALICL